MSFKTARRKRYKHDKGVSRVLPSSPHRREGLFYGEAKRKFLLGLSLAGFDPDSDIRFAG
jgi:hypothetical protein